MPNNIGENPCFCYFALFLIVSAFISKPYSSRELTIFMISSISLFENINAVVPDVAADTADGIKAFLANGVSIF